MQSKEEVLEISDSFPKLVLFWGNRIFQNIPEMISFKIWNQKTEWIEFVNNWIPFQAISSV